MSVRPILKHPDPVLRVVCDEVSVFDGALAELAQDMLETMYGAEGRGLAGPQIGITQRIFVFDAVWKEGPAAPVVCINPVIEPVGDSTQSFEESCLSIPDHPVEVTRPAVVRMRWQDVTGAAHEAQFDGAAAVVVQHEADHLVGRLCIDYEEAAP